MPANLRSAGLAAHLSRRSAPALPLSSQTVCEALHDDLPPREPPVQKPRNPALLTIEPLRGCCRTHCLGAGGPPTRVASGQVKEVVVLLGPFKPVAAGTGLIARAGVGRSQPPA